MCAVEISSPELRKFLSDRTQRTGSREIDVLIALSVNLVVNGISVSRLVSMMSLAHIVKEADSHQSVLREAIPRYTTSLDAAVTLYSAVGRDLPVMIYSNPIDIIRDVLL